MNSANSAALYSHHMGQSGSVGRSPRIFASAVESAMAPGRPASPIFESDEFVRFNDIAPAIAGPATVQANGYTAYCDTATTASSIKQVASETGVIELATGATAHHQAIMQMGGPLGAFWRIAAARASGMRGFEARVAVPVSSAAQGAFVGLAAAGNAALAFFANTTMVLKDTDLIGFHFPIGASNVIRPVYRKTGSAVVDSIGAVHTYTAGEFVKLGILYNPTSRGDGEVLSFFVNNVKVGGVAADTAEATLPLGVNLTPTLAVKTSGASAASLRCDWLEAFRF